MHTGSLAKTKWIIDTAHSNISFTVKHLMITNVKGAFKIFDASIYTTGKDFTTTQVDLWIDAASIDTGDEKRDEHLRSADFFDVNNFKQIVIQPDFEYRKDLNLIITHNVLATVKEIFSLGSEIIGSSFVQVSVIHSPSSCLK